MHFWCPHLLIIPLVLFVCVHGQKTNPNGFVNIDCGLASGATNYHEFTGLTYVSDDHYIDTGINDAVPSQYYATSTEYVGLNTLRKFPDGIRNCYTIKPVTKGLKYLVRATFYYWDLSTFPKFDLYFGVNFWTTVAGTSLEDDYSYEIIAIAPTNYIDVCLVKTGQDIPFISTLELRPLNNSFYNLAGLAPPLLNRVYRDNFGSNATYRYPQDTHDRLWFNWTVGDASTAVSTSLSIESSALDIPSLVLQTAVISTGNQISISWPATYNQSTNQLVVLYFAEIQILQNKSVREFNIYSDGALLLDHAIDLQYLSARNISLTVSGLSRHNISLRSTSTTLSPIINGWEVYTILPVTALPTNDEDVTAINAIKASSDVLKNWSGDPCGPGDIHWTWVACRHDLSNISRITNLNLSSKGLTTKMSSAFGDLTALNTLDLSRNNLFGKIPSCLDQLVALTFLDLSENRNLLGTLPSGLQKRRANGLLTVNFNGTRISEAEHNKSWKELIIIIVGVVIALLTAGAAAVFYWYWMKNKNTHINPTTSHELKTISTDNRSSEMNFCDSASGAKDMNFDKKQFTLEELRLITNDFSNQIGRGGFGKVFKGHLENGKVVAVKVRTETSSQGIKQFSTEVELLSRIHHKNLVSLIGYCKDSNHIGLVYDYMEEGSLEDHIRGNTDSIPWKVRLQIAYESALGLEYLHKMCDPPLIHRDVKSSNILLTKNLKAKISDFGLVRAFTGAHVSTKVVGTPGYVDPFYASTSQLTEKSDVYSFGVVLLELISGKSNILGGQHLSEVVKEMLSIGNIESIMDPTMGGHCNLNSIWKVADMALRCTGHPMKRPDMTTIVRELEECLNMEMSNIEMRQDKGYSRNYVNASGSAAAGSFELAGTGSAGPSDWGPFAR